jgi:hypothetical protein
VAVKTKRAPATRGDFYAKALSEAERVALSEALQVDGMDQEIALLRMRLRDAVTQSPEDLPLMFKGIALLARVVATRYRLGKTGREEIQEALVQAFTELEQSMGKEESGA